MDECQEVALDHIKVGSTGKDLHVIPFDYLFISSGCQYSENIKTNSPVRVRVRVRVRARVRVRVRIRVRVRVKVRVGE